MQRLFECSTTITVDEIASESLIFNILAIIFKSKYQENCVDQHWFVANAFYSIFNRIANPHVENERNFIQNVNELGIQ